MYVLVTDGACKGNPGSGGWAFILRTTAGDSEVSGHVPETTNNRMEMEAIIQGLRRISRGETVRVLTDSQYVVKAFTEGWLAKWEAKKWKNSDRKPVKNKDKWLELKSLVENLDVKWEWVKGHAGHPLNERADKLASKAAAEETHSS